MSISKNTTLSLGDRAKQLAQSVIDATGAASGKGGRTFLYGHSDITAGARHEEELVVAAVSFLNFTGWQASASRPWPWQRRKSTKPGEGQVEWVVDLRKK